MNYSIKPKKNNEFFQEDDPYKHFKNYNFSFIYNQSISRIWEVIRNVEKTSIIIDEFQPKIEFIKGNNSFQEGNEFKMLWKGLYNLIVKVIKVVDNTINKEIKWIFHGTDEYSEFVYITKYILKFSTTDKTTIFIWNLSLDETKFSQDQIEQFKKDKEKICVKFDNYLKHTADNLYNIESIIIRKNRLKIWNIITDWNLFHHYAPCISEKVEYEGDKLVIGSIITLKWDSKNIVCRLKIVKIDKIDSNNNWTFVLECFEGKPNLPNQQLHFTITKISENSSFINFKHEFKEPLKYEYFDPLIKHKKNILKCLKNALKTQKKP